MEEEKIPKTMATCCTLELQTLKFPLPISGCAGAGRDDSWQGSVLRVPHARGAVLQSSLVWCILPQEGGSGPSCVVWGSRTFLGQGMPCARAVLGFCPFGLSGGCKKKKKFCFLPHCPAPVQGHSVSSLSSGVQG